MKTDTLGRVRTSRERREALLEEFDRSGLSGTKFAELIGVKDQTFASWRQHRRRRADAVPAQKAAGHCSPLRWVEALLEEPSASGAQGTAARQVHLPGGARLEVTDRAQAVLAAEMMRAWTR